MTTWGTKSLDSVHEATDANDLTSAYANWANTYDQETASLGYMLPYFVTSWISRYIPIGDGPLLDAGCGTGLSGPALIALGYSKLDGLDLSQEMLEIAKGRESYQNLKKAVLGETLPWSDGYFKCTFSTGVFTVGHAPASSLRELCRITQKGGYVIFTVRNKVFTDGGFNRVIDQLVKDGKWEETETSPWFRCYSVGDPEALVRTFVYKVL